MQELLKEYDKAKKKADNLLCISLLGTIIDKGSNFVYRLKLYLEPQKDRRVYYSFEKLGYLALSRRYKDIQRETSKLLENQDLELMDKINAFLLLSKSLAE